MGLDVDYIAAKQAIDELEKMLSDTPHGEREDIADAIIDLIENFKKEKTENKIKATKEGKLYKDNPIDNDVFEKTFNDLQKGIINPITFETKEINKKTKSAIDQSAFKKQRQIELSRYFNLDDNIINNLKNLFRYRQRIAEIIIDINRTYNEDAIKQANELFDFINNDIKKILGLD